VQKSGADFGTNKRGNLKKIFLLVIAIFCIKPCAYATESAALIKAPVMLKQTVHPKTVATQQKSVQQGQVSASIPPVEPQPVDFGHCSSFFKLDSPRLFYLTLASVNANRFKIDEIQSKSGYVLFTVAQRQFLASVISIDSKTSMLKITPCNNVYYFPIGIVQNMFKYIELNINTPIEKLVVL